MEDIVRRDYRKTKSLRFTEGCGGGPTQYLEFTMSLKANVRSLHPVKSCIWVASNDGSVHVRKAKDGHLLRKIRPSQNKFNPSRIISNTIQKQYHTVWTGCSDGVLRGWTTSGDLKFERSGHKGGIKCLASNSSHVWSWSDDFKLVERNQTGRVTREVQHKSQWLRAMIVVEGFLWTACDDSILVWARGQLVAVLQGHNGTVLSLLFHADKVFSGCTSGTICLWNWKEFTLIRKINCGKQWVSKLVCLRDVVISSSPDGHFCMWDAATGNLIKILRHANSDLSKDNDGVLTEDSDYNWLLEESETQLNPNRRETRKLVDMAISEDGNFFWLAYKQPSMLQVFRLVQSGETLFPSTKIGPLLEYNNSSLMDEEERMAKQKLQEISCREEKLRIQKHSLRKHKNCVQYELKEVQKRMEEFKRELQFESSKLLCNQGLLQQKTNQLKQQKKINELQKNKFEKIQSDRSKNSKELVDLKNELSRTRKDKEALQRQIAELSRDSNSARNLEAEIIYLKKEVCSEKQNVENCDLELAKTQRQLELERNKLKLNYEKELIRMQEKFEKMQSLAKSFNTEERNYIQQLSSQLTTIESQQTEISSMTKKLNNLLDYKRHAQKRAEEQIMSSEQTQILQRQVLNLTEETSQLRTELEKSYLERNQIEDKLRKASEGLGKQSLSFSLMLDAVIDECALSLIPFAADKHSEGLVSKHELILNWIQENGTVTKKKMQDFKEQVYRLNESNQKAEEQALELMNRESLESWKRNREVEHDEKDNEIRELYSSLQKLESQNRDSSSLRRELDAVSLRCETQEEQIQRLGEELQNRDSVIQSLEGDKSQSHQLRLNMEAKISTSQMKCNNLKSMQDEQTRKESNELEKDLFEAHSVIGSLKEQMEKSSQNLKQVNDENLQFRNQFDRLRNLKRLVENFETPQAFENLADVNPKSFGMLIDDVHTLIETERLEQNKALLRLDDLTRLNENEMMTRLNENMSKLIAALPSNTLPVSLERRKIVH